MVGVMATSFQMVYARTAVFSVTHPTIAMLTHASPGDSWALTGKSASVSCEGHCSFLLVPSVHKVLFVPSKSLSPVPWKFCNQIPLAFKGKFPEGSQSLCWIPMLGNLLWALELS